MIDVRHHYPVSLNLLYGAVIDEWDASDKRLLITREQAKAIPLLLGPFSGWRFTEDGLVANGMEFVIGADL